MFKLLFAVILLALVVLPTSVSAQSRNVWIDGDHGKLSAVVQTLDGLDKFPLVIICHGITGCKNHFLYAQLAEDLEELGIASIRFDFNGHGKSDGRFQDMTVPNEIEDARHVYEYAKNLRGVTSVSIAGHSQGGVVASMLAGQLGAKKIKAVTLMAPAAVLRDNARAGEFLGASCDPANPPEYVEIFGVFKLGRNYILTAQNLPIYETAAKYTGSALIVHGTADPLVPYGYGLRYHDTYKNSRIELLNGFDHNFTQDTQRVSEIVADFFASQLK
ncbi:MAG: alpha/beta fold hydrolase [Selenomonadaceae bacterium]|nr:alpha/beta fold hydrolase [Selenomonadaceae bacterium]